MNRQEQTEFNHLKKVNKNLRDKIYFAIKKYIPEKTEENEFIWLWIGCLIDNEIEQETYTNI